MNWLATAALALGTITMANGVAAQEPYDLAPPSLEADHPDPYNEQIARFEHGNLKKIVGGMPALPGQFPWQVSLGVAKIPTPAGAHFCGGAIYSDRWIVTAAHCVVGRDPEDIIVTVGTVNLAKGGRRIGVARILVKDGYVSPRRGYDVALLQLKEPIPLDGTTAAPVPLGSSAEPVDADVVVSGFGYTLEGGEVSATLNYAVIPVVAHDECNAPLSYDGAVKADMFCAGVPGGLTDSCNGDSGGPVVADLSNQSHLAGVVSWGDVQGCARPLKYGVYVRLPLYKSWIEACTSASPDCTLLAQY